MTTSPANPTTEKPAKKRVQLKHLLIDVDFNDNPKIIDLSETHGELAVWFLVKLLMAMSRATNGEISRRAAEGIGRRTGLSLAKATSILNHCLDIDILGVSGETLTNSRVIADQEALANKRESQNKRQEQHRDKGVTNALPTRDPDTVSDTDTELIRSNKNCAVDFSATELRELVAKFPAFPEPNTGVALIDWCEFQDREFKKHIGIQHIEAQLMSYSGREKDLARDIHASIAAGYRKVYPEAKANSPNPNGHHKKTNFERNMDILKASNERYGNKQTIGGIGSNLPKLPIK